MRNKFPPARTYNDEVPARLDFMINKMLAKEPKFRYQTCANLIKDLESLDLANPALSFVAGATPSVVRRAAKTVAPAAAEPDPEDWYVKALNFDGVRKMTRRQVVA